MNNAMKLLAVLLIAGGLFVLIYGGFSYPKSHEAKLGSVAFNVKTDEHVNVPVWAAGGAVALGALLLLIPVSRRR